MKAKLHEAYCKVLLTMLTWYTRLALKSYLILATTHSYPIVTGLYC